MTVPAGPSVTLELLSTAPTFTCSSVPIPGTNDAAALPTDDDGGHDGSHNDHQGPEAGQAPGGGPAH